VDLAPRRRNGEDVKMAERKTVTTGTWMAVGLAMGAGIGLLFDNLTMGMAIGLMLGIVFGQTRGTDSPEQTSGKE
jgi:uncharacterized membrane protein